MNKILDVKTLFIVLLIGILVYQNCNLIDRPKDQVTIDGIKYDVLKYKVDTFERIKNKTLVKNGEDIYHESLYVDTQFLNKNIDTAAILIKFFTNFEYKDTLFLPDSLGYVFVTDTITQNKIKTRTYNAKVIERIIDSTTILKESLKNEFYIGPNATFNKVSLVNSVGGSILYKSKKNNNVYQISTGIMSLNGSTVPYFGGGVYFKINK